MRKQHGMILILPIMAAEFLNQKCSLSPEDMTPPDFQIPLENLNERWKRPVRRFLYPALNFFQTIYFRRLVPADLKANSVLYGQRGNDYERNRRKLNAIVPIQGKKILIGGCGTGRDILPWLPFNPQQLVCVDFFNYSSAWQKMKAYISKKYPNFKNRIEFFQADLENLSQVPDHSIDIFGCDAVFEHCKDLPKVLKEIKRVLIPGGYLYAGFGPLYHCWGGDHFSGSSRFNEGYHHLLLTPEEYQTYLNSFPPLPCHLPHEGRTFIDTGLFSFLKSNEYLALFEKIGHIRKLDVMISPEALRFKKQYSGLWNKLLGLPGIREFDLMCLVMVVVLQVSSIEFHRNESGHS